MLQKILVVLVGLVMSIVGALAPAQLFASKNAPDLGSGASLDALHTTDQTLATVRSADGVAFAKLSILWVESEGTRVTQDAWGTGQVKELKFAVGTKGVDGLALEVGSKMVPVKPTDVITIRMFEGDFAYRDLGTSDATLQLQGTVKTTLLDEGAKTGKLTTATTGVPSSTRAGGPGETQRISFVTLGTGQNVDTVDLQNGGARLLTSDETTSAPSASQAGNLLVKWVKISGKSVNAYTWGNGEVDRIEFQPAGAADQTLLAFDRKPTTADAGAHVLVQGYVGEYLVYQVNGGLLRLRLDGYASNVTTGVAGALPAASTAGLLPGLPLPAFEAGPTPARTTDVIQFRDRSVDDGVIVLWRWDFGDGTSTVVQEPTHRYARPGIYNVTLNVTDDDLNAVEVVRTIIVNNADPVPDFDINPKVVSTDSLVAFTDHSIDPDGYIVNWSWSFGDGTTSFARHPNHHFEKSGNLAVALTVTDDLGGRTTITKTLLVRNSPPHAAFEFGPMEIRAKQDVTFHSTSTDRDGTIVDAVWSFGKGSDTARGKDVTHQFPHPGPYDVTLTVTDNLGDVDTVTGLVVVLNQGPTADYTYTPLNATSAVNVTFDGRTSSDVDGFIILDEWDFGDGTNTSVGYTITRCVTPQPDCQQQATLMVTYDPMRPNASNTAGGNPLWAPPPGYGAPPPIPHRFPHQGNYTVTLCVTDNLLAKACTSHLVGIDNSLPFVDIRVPEHSQRSVDIPIEDHSFDADDGVPVRLSWKVDNVLDTLAPVPRIILRNYTVISNHTVELRVQDSAGAIGIGSKTFSVVNIDPRIRSLTQDIPSPSASIPVLFTADAFDPDSNDPLTYQWTVSDGGVGSGTQLNHTFALSGNYTVTVRVFDLDGGQASVQRRVTVIVSPPVPSFNVACATCVPAHPEEPTVGQSVKFNDTSVPTSGPITKWSWSFGDGHTFTTTDPNLRNTTHTYTTGTPGPAVYTIVLTISSANQPDTSASRTMHVNSPPDAQFAYPAATPTAHVPMTFTDASTDPDGQNTIVTRHWEWGDGTTTDTSDTQVDHTYEHAGTKQVNLTVTDDHGANSTKQKSFVVDDRAPTARFHVDLDLPSVAHGCTQLIDDSTDPEGNATIQAWKWTFKENATTTTIFQGNVSATFQNPCHSFNASGQHLVTLSVFDGDFWSSPTSLAVRVNADHEVVFEINATLPSGAGVHLTDSHYDLNLGMTVIGAAGFSLNKSLLGTNGDNVTFTVGAGAWAEGDTATITLSALLPGMQKPAVDHRSYPLRDTDTGPVPTAFVVNIPVVANLTAIPYNDTDLLDGTGPGWDGGVVYHDMQQPFRGNGTVKYVDGTPVPGTQVIIQLRYLPLYTTSPLAHRSLRDSGDNDIIPTNDLVGWCEADREIVEPSGGFNWTVRPTTQCLFPAGCANIVITCIPKPQLFLFGHWEARAIALPHGSESRYSERVSMFVDPVGIFAKTYLP